MLNGSACDAVPRPERVLRLIFFLGVGTKEKPMSEIKQNKYASFVAEQQLARGGSGAATATKPLRRDAQQNGREVTSWDAYRNWLTKVQAPEQKRSLPDPALFSFRGYRSWAEKIRRDWETDD